MWGFYNIFLPVVGGFFVGVGILVGGWVVYAAISRAIKTVIRKRKLGL